MVLQSYRAHHLRDAKGKLKNISLRKKLLSLKLNLDYRGSSLRKYFSKMYKSMKSKGKPSWYEIKDIGKNHTIMNELSWYNMKCIRKSNNYQRT